MASTKKRIVALLPVDDYQKLAEIAEREDRVVDQQASHLIRNALKTVEAQPLLLLQWPWLSALGEADLDEFLQNLKKSLLAARDQHTMDPVNAVVQQWQTSAEILIDPTQQQIRANGFAYGDFVEVHRPE